jgi:glycosyltransferase involved in cell wall biosynthesis
VVIPYTFDYTDKEGLREKALDNLFDAIRNQSVKDSEIIVVEYIIQGREPKFRLQEYTHKYFKISYPKLFNKSWCLNTGIKRAYFNDIICIDADNLFDEFFFEKIIDFKNICGKDFFLCYNHYIKLPGRDDKLRILTGKERFGISGTFYTSKDFFYKQLGGANEAYWGYGGEDDDLTARVEWRFLDKCPRMDYTILHQYHHWVKPAEDRFKQLEITIKNPEKAIKILKENYDKLGDLLKPASINFE